MLWLNPAALFALAAVAAPILIHILIQRRAERLLFPTLRFLQPTRLAAIRRHVLEDPVLLAVRVGILAAAAAALAGPLIVTAARRQAWDQRIVRAAVVEGNASAAAADSTFSGASLADGVRRAVLWLETAPPARREIVIASALPIGSITSADIAAIPSGIGVRFERTGTLPAARTVAAGSLLTPGAVQNREVTFDGDRTSVRDTPAVVSGFSRTSMWPIDVVASKADQPASDAAMAAVLSQHVWAGPADHRVRLLVNSDPVPSPIQQPWMMDVVAHLARDPDLAAAGARFGRPLYSAGAAGDQLVVASAAPAADLATPLLMRAIANALGIIPDLRGAEVVPIADAQLRQWSRPATPLASPRLETMDQDDRRWLWLAVVCLLGAEMWIRRARRTDEAIDDREETARVA